MKFLIAGLGNPGEEYRNTRHNIGFLVLDALASASGSIFRDDRLARVTEMKHKGRTLVLIQPQTFMNLSGRAVNYWLQKEKLDPSRMLVITDDLALPFGTIRIRGKGSDGGHNGLKDISEVLQTSEYPRLRFGIGSEFSKGRQVDYVLGRWSPEELKTLEERINKACEAILSFTTAGLALTMTSFNGK